MAHKKREKERKRGFKGQGLESIAADKRSEQTLKRGVVLFRSGLLTVPIVVGAALSVVLWHIAPIAIGIVAVSYTHLDVYKRQAEEDGSAQHAYDAPCRLLRKEGNGRECSRHRKRCLLYTSRCV